jgi:hypothetical protein
MIQGTTTLCGHDFKEISTQSARVVAAKWLQPRCCAEMYIGRADFQCRML